MGWSETFRTSKYKLTKLFILNYTATEHFNSLVSKMENS